MSACVTQKGHASTKLQYEPLSVKHTFPLSVLSFPWLHVSPASLLSKKGLRYLLYPFISLWMVGGRISPSFTSALSSELSNNLRTKTEKERERAGERQKEELFSPSSWVYLVDSFTQPPPLFTESAGRQFTSTANLSNRAKSKRWEKIEVATWNWKSGKPGRNRGKEQREIC